VRATQRSRRAGRDIVKVRVDTMSAERARRASVTALFAAAAFSYFGCELSMPIVDGAADVFSDAATDTTANPSDAEPSADATLDASCAAGQTFCGSECADLSNDPHHCGACDQDCTALANALPTIACIAGSCDTAHGCPPGLAHCLSDPATGCDTPIDDAAHCGSCTTLCSGTTPVCAPSGASGFACASGCAFGSARCGTACADLMTDAMDCGACGTICAAGQHCSAGHCIAACPPMFPVTSFNASANAANACNVTAIRANDRVEAGLDYYTVSATIDTHLVTGCVGADFGALSHLGHVTVRANSKPSACGAACTLAGCGTGDVFELFVGSTRGVYRYVGVFAITAIAADYTAVVNADARFVVVCRGGSGSGRDDVGVDSVSASCM
jgi:hypothetical protein